MGRIYSGELKSMRPGRFFGTSQTQGANPSNQAYNNTAGEGYFSVAADSGLFFPIETPLPAGAESISHVAIKRASTI